MMEIMEIDFDESAGSHEMAEFSPWWRSRKAEIEFDRSEMTRQDPTRPDKPRLRARLG